ncbi:MAG: hypothetical protein IPM39_27725 [Chloroflexi bacterium]|nr:hypothetical protein [Chloroflexota bacterium]
MALNGRADMSRLAFFGHSRGGEGRQLADQQPGSGLARCPRNIWLWAGSRAAAAGPSAVFTKPTGSLVPQVVILPACDGDVVGQDGQLFEGARLDPSQKEWALSVWLEQANHNALTKFLTAT